MGSGTTGSTGQRGAGGGRGRGGRSGTRATHSGRGQQPTRQHVSSFKGGTSEMNGHVFQCSEEQTDRSQYKTTLEALQSHVKKSFQYPEDLAPLFATTMTEPEIIMPREPGANPSRTEDMIYAEQVKQYVKREGLLASNKAATHAVIWGQCSEAMKTRVKTFAGFQGRAEANDCFWLLQKIRAVTMELDEKKHGTMSLLDARCELLICRQGLNQTVSKYKETLKGWADAIRFHGGTVAERIDSVPMQDAAGNELTTAQREEIATEQTLAMLMIRGADPTKYGTLIAELSNQFTRGKDEYPMDMASAESMLELYEPPVNQPAAHRPPAARNTGTAPRAASSDDSALTFAQQGATYAERVAASVAGTDGVVHPGITCRGGCQGYGHYAGECPSATAASGTTLTQYAFMLAQSNDSGIDPSWILLDSQSTISVFKNPGMLTNIRRSKRTLRAITNGGHQDSNMVGDFPNLGEVWYNSESIANILSLAEVRKICRVTMDSHDEPAIHVHRLDGSVMKFAEHESGLYVYNPNVTNKFVTGYSILSTVAAQKKLFSRREIKAADVARELYRKLGRPNETEFDSILRKNLIRNCPVTPSDAKRALIIYGPDIAVLKGKTTRTTAAPRVPTFEAVPIPPPILEHHRKVTLCIDFFFVQGMPFYHTISRGIGFRTARRVSDRGKAVILQATRSVVNLYQSRGFHVCDIHADNEFECVREHVRPVETNIVPADSHVGEIERSVRTLKERLRTCVHGLPFARLPKLMIQHMVDDAVRCLNQFPWKNGISADLSPAAIVTGTPPPDFNKMRLEFGTYVQVFEDNDPTNTTRARSMGAIALGPTGNAQGDYNFMSLSTGARISRHQWVELPMTDTAIARVNALGFDDEQPLIQDRGLVVEWRPDHPIDDYEYDRDYVLPPNAPDDVVFDDFDPIGADEAADLLRDAAAHAHLVAPADDHVALAQGANEEDVDPNQQHHHNRPNAQPVLVDLDDEVAIDYADHEGAPNDNAAHEGAPNDYDDVSYEGAPHADDAPHEGAHEENDDASYEGAHEENDDASYEGAHEENDDASYEEAHEDNDNHDDASDDASDEGAQHEDGATNDNDDGGNITRPYNLRHRRGPATTARRFNEAMDNPHDGKSYYPPTQLTQHVTNTIKRVYGFIMTQMTAKAGIKKHGRAAEEALMQEFAQFETLNVYEALDSRLLTTEQRRGALRAISLIKEKEDGILKGRTVADGSVQRSLYDKSETASPTVATDALLLSIIIDAYERRDVATADVAGAYLKAYMDDFVIMKFTGDSVDILCKLNPEHTKFVVFEKGIKVLYVRLIKAIYGCVKSALLWYKVFHSSLREMGFVLNPYDSCVANCMIEGKQCTVTWYVDDTKISHENPEVVTTIINKLEEHFGKMKVTRGKEHVFLGMHIKYTDAGTAVVSMRRYLKEAMDECGLDIKREASTPARRTLFEVDQTSTPLEKGAAETFHRIVAKLLYVAIRARMDILLTIGFLCTRVSNSTRQDQNKLRRLLEYIKGTIDLEYTLGADSMGKLRTWVDASYAVHPDMKSHTGGVMSLGTGGFIPKSGKQKLNTKSSTEAELVGASDYLPHTMWAKMFLEAQGYKLEENYLEQDNESAIKMEKNGRSSAGPRSRHIDIRYFWIKDRMEANGIKVRHCPTLQMLADFFTKPLQGALFTKFRDVILGYKHINSLVLDPTPALEERVGSTLERANGCGTDGPDAEFTSVLKKSTGVSWADVVRKGEVTNSERKSRPTKKVVSRDHSLETIPLTK